MKKTILIILISFAILGCRTKKTLKNESTEVLKEQSISKIETVEKENSKESTSKESLQVKNIEKKEEKNDIQIAGKVDKENPIEFYNVVNGDTINLFRIKGNADFIFKASNKAEKSNVNINSTNSLLKQNNSEKSASNIIENIKNTTKEVKSKTVEVVKKEVTFGVYLTIFIWGIVIIGLIVLYQWVKKSTWFTSIINKFKL